MSWAVAPPSLSPAASFCASPRRVPPAAPPATDHRHVDQVLVALVAEEVRLGAQNFLKAAKGEAGSARRGGETEEPGRAGRQVRAVRLRRHSKLDHVCR